MAQKSYVFNDTETTGLNTWFSQIIQIGSVLTDNEFNVEEELNLNSKVLPWVVPTKGAYETHRQINNLNEGMSHFDMMHFLKNKWLGWGKTKELVHVTYNGMKFDEELFRRQFYWNLIDPYLTTNVNGSSRVDLMVIMFLIANFFSDKVKIPTDDEGNLRYKLEMVAEANGISSLNAHDAVVDSYLMINLVRLINEKIPQLWESAVSTATKKDFIVAINKEPFSMFAEIVKGQAFNYPVYPCAQNSKKPNEVLLADLYFDPKELFEMSYSELKGQIGKSGAFKKIAINKTQPIVNVNLIDNADKFLDLSQEVLADRAQMINKNQDFKQKLSQILEDDDKTWPEKNIVEQKIYDGFSSSADKLWMERFEISNWDEKVKLIDGFEDERYRELATRIICYEKPEFATEEMLENYNNLVRSRLFSKGPWNTPGETLDQATLKVEAAIRETEDSEKKEIYEQLLNHYKTKTDQFSQS
ncbi:MAG: exonuclease [Proteobacteria bacterium]|nr:exonuclease [Pseudomonadota bacterium]